MSKVFIFGAGASAHADGPLMFDFLDRAERVMRTESLTPADKRAFERVFDTAASLQLAQAKAHLDLTNVEHLFSAFEMADMMKLQLGEERWRSRAQDMRRLIARTLQYAMPFEIRRRAESYSINPSRTYGELAKRIKESEQSPTLITFNYDLALDYALQKHGFRLNYGLGETSDPNSLRLLKLHGSLHWAAPSTGPVKIVDLIGQLRTVGIPSSGNLPLDLSEKLSELGAPHGVPFVVPPTWNKWSHQKRISPVWAEAARALRDAEHLAVIGYSLPATDQFFRYLFAMGIMGETRIKRILLLDPSEDVHDRFRKLLGQSTINRLDYVPDKWEEAPRTSRTYLHPKVVNFVRTGS